LQYILPALYHILKMPKLEEGDGPIALVLAPTRELAQQIQAVISIFSRTMRIRHACLYGGTSKMYQVILMRILISATNTSLGIYLQ
jgi:Superfamily II DNA and RNA helicases